MSLPSSDSSDDGRLPTGPAAINLTFGSTVKATVICSTGSPKSCMRKSLYEKIKALPNAQDFIIGDNKIDFTHVKMEDNKIIEFSHYGQKIIAVIELKAVLDVGVTVEMTCNVVESLSADAILGWDFFKSLPDCHINAMFFKFNHGSKRIKVKFLDYHSSEEGEEEAIFCGSLCL